MCSSKQKGIKTDFFKVVNKMPLKSPGKTVAGWKRTSEKEFDICLNLWTLYFILLGWGVDQIRSSSVKLAFLPSWYQIMIWTRSSTPSAFPHSSLSAIGNQIICDRQLGRIGQCTGAPCLSFIGPFPSSAEAIGTNWHSMIPIRGIISNAQGGSSSRFNLKLSNGFASWIID